MKKRIIIFLMIPVLFLVTCKKDDFQKYENDFYIRIPLFESNTIFFDPGIYYDGLYISDFAASGTKRLWKFTRIKDDKFTISPADSTSLVIYAPGNEASMTSLSKPVPDAQVFRIVPSPNNSGLVSFQSVSSGKFVELAICWKGSEVWGFHTPIDDSSHCTALDIGFSNQADTCYCLHEFELLKQ